MDEEKNKTMNETKDLEKKWKIKQRMRNGWNKGRGK